MIELHCRSCGQPFDVDRRDMLAGPDAYNRCPPCREADNYPRVPATAVWSERDRLWALTVGRCPFCGKRHYHGGNDGPEPNLGARLSHCITGEGGTYILVETEASRRERSRLRAKRVAA